MSLKAELHGGRTKLLQIIVFVMMSIPIGFVISNAVNSIHPDMYWFWQLVLSTVLFLLFIISLFFWTLIISLIVFVSLQDRLNGD